MSTKSATQLDVDFEVESFDNAVKSIDRLLANIKGTAFRVTKNSDKLANGKMRGERTEHNGVVILNDAYNANPEAMRSMLDVLAATPARRRIAVLGEMLELGPAGPSLHAASGAAMAGHGVDIVVGVRGLASELVDAARKAGSSRAASWNCTRA